MKWPCRPVVVYLASCCVLLAAATPAAPCTTDDGNGLLKQQARSEGDEIAAGGRKLQGDDDKDRDGDNTTVEPTPVPTTKPPTRAPTAAPTRTPTSVPTPEPTAFPTVEPTYHVPDEEEYRVTATNTLNFFVMNGPEVAASLAFRYVVLRALMQTAKVPDYDASVLDVSCSTLRRLEEAAPAANNSSSGTTTEEPSQKPPEPESGLHIVSVEVEVRLWSSRMYDLEPAMSDHLAEACEEVARSEPDSELDKIVGKWELGLVAPFEIEPLTTTTHDGLTDGDIINAAPRRCTSPFLVQLVLARLLREVMR
eukprot:TRINITY_DN75137_c0_g1_i1.p1 TRINITY_DN75137_c0_g1~~TRINITY_DN75137_c0_g1_i1.p1  ORF type:complete len:309 (-),score=54.74 TRINITY_DN75137_c0_g1_i1:90-1016(-)